MCNDGCNICQHLFFNHILTIILKHISTSSWSIFNIFAYLYVYVYIYRFLYACRENSKHNVTIVFFRMKSNSVIQN